jgi:hypothetical protein
VTLEGGGTVQLQQPGTEQAAPTISGLNVGAPTLDNINNTISGTGQIGDDNNSLTFNNSGTVDANVSAKGSGLAIDTGNTIANNEGGVLEATNGGTLYIDDAVNNSGTVLADGGTVDVVTYLGGAINGGAAQITGGGAFDFYGASSENISFAGGGTLELGLSVSYTGTVGDFGSGDVLDLTDLTYAAGGSVQWTPGADGNPGTLTVTVGATSEEFSLSGNYSSSDFALTPDSSVGTDVVWFDTFTNADSDFNWFTPADWSDAAVPGASDQAAIAANVNFSSSSSFTVGSLIVAAGDTLNVEAGTLTLSANGSSLDGTINAQGGTFALDGSLSISNTGELIATGGALDLAGDINNGNFISADNGSEIVLGTQNGVTITGGNLDIGTSDILSINQQDSATLDDVLVYNQGAIDVGTAVSGTLTLTDGTTITGDLTIGSAGTVNITSGVNSAILTFDGVTVTDDDTSPSSLDIESGATLSVVGETTTFTGDGALTLAGTLQVSGGTLLVDSGVGFNSDGGTVTITEGGTADFQDVVDPNVTFVGTGTLELAYPQSYDGTMSGFGAGDTLDLSNFAFSTGETVTWNQNGSIGDLEFNGETNSQYNGTELFLSGTYAQSNFALEQDASGNTAVVYVGSSVPILPGATYYEPTGESSVNVTFTASTGEFVLPIPQDYSGDIIGISGSGDILDLGGFFANTGDVFDVYPLFRNGDTTLIVSDMTDSMDVSVTLVGNYTSDNWTAVSDGDGGAYVVDPPASAAAVIAAGASLDINTPSNENVTFTGGTGSLVLTDPEGFTGQIIGFTGTAPNAAHSDTIDLVGINYDSSHFAESYNSLTGLLTVTDGTNTANIAFDDFNATLDFASDGNGGTLITDPPATDSAPEDGHGALPIEDVDTSHTEGNFFVGVPNEGSAGSSGGFAFMSGHDQIDLTFDRTLTQPQDAGATDAQNTAATPNQLTSVSIGGPGNDHFVFTPGVNDDPVTNFNPHHDTVELNHSAETENIQELQSLIAKDAHGDALVNPVHNDNVTLPGLNPPEVQQLIHANHVWLH